MSYFKGVFVAVAGLAIAALIFGAGPSAARQAGGEADWAMNTTIIEACSCPMF
jgi:hypothetical protein